MPANERDGAGNLQQVPSGNDGIVGSVPADVEQEQVAKERARHRRAQVRRAQIQHRERKANHTKELEHDVNRYRELIAIAERELCAIRRENSTMRTLLDEEPASSEAWEQTEERAGAESSFSGLEGLQIQDQGDAFTGDMLGHLDIDLDDFTVMMRMDYTMGTPALAVRSNSTDPSINSLAISSPGTAALGARMSALQEQTAINFILALEHICWNHFHVGDFPGHAHQDEIVRGHMLMASSQVMASAPEPYFTERQSLATFMTENQVPETSRLSTVTVIPDTEVPNFEWQSVGISLDSLRTLAESLSPSDEEITPVQAWFELAEMYSADVLLQPAMQEALKREFRGVVDCVHFGAVMERQAFESVAARVLGLLAE